MCGLKNIKETCYVLVEKHYTLYMLCVGKHESLYMLCVGKTLYILHGMCSLKNIKYDTCYVLVKEHCAGYMLLAG